MCTFELDLLILILFLSCNTLNLLTNSVAFVEVEQSCLETPGKSLVVVQVAVQPSKQLFGDSKS